MEGVVGEQLGAYSGDRLAPAHTHTLQAIIKMMARGVHPTALICWAGYLQAQMQENSMRLCLAPAELHGVRQKSPCNLSPF